jgi:hypothetical protein
MTRSFVEPETDYHRRHAACVRSYSVLFTTTIDIIHTLSAAAATGSLKRAMQRYLKPKLLVVDEDTYRSTSSVPTCCSRLSPSVMSAAPSS